MFLGGACRFPDKLDGEQAQVSHRQAGATGGAGLGAAGEGAGRPALALQIAGSSRPSRRADGQPHSGCWAGDLRLPAVECACLGRVWTVGPARPPTLCDACGLAA